MSAFDKFSYIYGRVRVENDEPRENEGIEDGKITALLSGLEIELPPFLRQLYRWHNGIGYALGFLSLPSLESAVERYRMLMKWRGGEIGSDFKRTLFPVFDYNAAVTFCIDVKDGQLVAIDPEADCIEVLANNYEDFLDAVIDAIHKGAIAFGRGGEVQANYVQWVHIARSHNVSSDPL